MSLDVRCPACDKGFFVDAACAGEELVCPSCLSPVPVPSLAVAAAATAHVASVRMPARPTGIVQQERAQSIPLSETAPGGGSTAVATAVAPALDPGLPAGEQTEIVCPRCQLHFVPKQSHRIARAGRKSILIVEDQSFFRDLAKDALSDKYEVKFASSNLEAKAILAQGGVSLLVLDLTLANGDQGIDLLRGMALKPCPILIYTSRDESEMYGEEWEELKRLGADDVVMKNMKVDESLLLKVATALGDVPADDAQMD